MAENINRPIATINNKELHDSLWRAFKTNYKVYELIETERTELTTMRKKPNEEMLSLINLIAKEYLDKERSSKQLSFELINGFGKLLCSNSQITSLFQSYLCYKTSFCNKVALDVY